MKQDKTNVKFLVEKPEGDLPCNVFAFFPDEPFNHWDNGSFMSYGHVGQHSPCHIDYANQCKEAREHEYKALKHELEQLGYKLNVLNNKPQTTQP